MSRPAARARGMRDEGIMVVSERAMGTQAEWREPDVISLQNIHLDLGARNR